MLVLSAILHPEFRRQYAVLSEIRLPLTIFAVAVDTIPDLRNSYFPEGQAQVEFC